MKKSLLVLALVVSCKANAFDVKQFDSFAQKCAPAISTDTLKALVKTESSFNPYAIGVVNGSIAQPKTFDEAIKAVEQLEAEGKNYSIGLGQINKHNFNRFTHDYKTLFDPCENLKATQVILSECYQRASKDKSKTKGQALADALSLYYSGNMTTGYKEGYVYRVSANANTVTSIPSVTYLQGSTNKRTDFVVQVNAPNSQSLASQEKSQPKLIF